MNQPSVYISPLPLEPTTPQPTHKVVTEHQVEFPVLFTTNSIYFKIIEESRRSSMKRSLKVVKCKVYIFRHVFRAE